MRACRCSSTSSPRHGARKGLVDTALRTADSGYLTRRLVDVAQELIVREDDCGTTRGIWVEDVEPDDAEHVARYLETKLLGRALLDDVTLSDGTVLPAQHRWSATTRSALLRDDPASTGSGCARCSPATPSSGVCAPCYGRRWPPASSIELGEAVGVIAAQSIGEPGTQLTMRTFHTGGVAGEDIAGGLPACRRAVRGPHARRARPSSPRTSGVVRIGEDEGKGERRSPSSPTTATRTSYTVAAGRTASSVARRPGGHGRRRSIADERPRRPEGAPRDQGRPRDPAVPRRRGPEGVPRPGRVDPRQAHRADRAPDDRAASACQEPGDSDFLPGERVDASRSSPTTNRRLVEEGKRPAEGRPELMGITKASLATDSWLSAASFQETTRVLTEAAIDGRGDSLSASRRTSSSAS